MKIIVFLICAVSPLVAPLHSSPPSLPAGLKIMPLGDSITQGSRGTNAGYRGPLHALLQPIAPGMIYVGSSVAGSGSLPADQLHHEGHASYTIDDINENLDGLDTKTFDTYGGADRDPNGGHWLDGLGQSGEVSFRAPLFPDIILLMIGTNDTRDPDRLAVEARLRELLEKIIALRPKAQLIVAQIPPCNRPNVASYNTCVANAVTRLKTAGKLVSLVDMFSKFPTDGLSGDNVHPNDTGYTFMADQWYSAILAVDSPQP